MSVTTRAAYWVGTWFGCGYAPKAPGTVGTLGAIPLYSLIRGMHPVSQWSVVLAICLLGVWAAEQVAAHRGEQDPQIVVIDEVGGVLIALCLVTGHGLLSELFAVIAFRVLDITKPPPIRQLEHLRPPGLGIMVDDLLAGAIAGMVIRWIR